MSYCKKLNPEEAKKIARQKVQDLSKQLEEGLKNLYKSDNYKKWLLVASKFHNYSVNNQILIMLQRPDASRVASFTTWKSLKRNVNKDAVGIKIFAPAPVKEKKEVPVTDKDGQVVKDINGEVQTEDVDTITTYFKVVHVFDIADTNGEPLPKLGIDELKGKVENFDVIFDVLKSVAPVPVGFEDITSGAKGYYSLVEQRIAIKSGMDDIATLKTLIHETAHSLLHDKKNGTLIEGEDVVKAAIPIKELQAESVAFIVSSYLGMDTSEYSFPYLAFWQNNPEMSDFKDNLDIIQKTANFIIDKVDDAFAEKDKQKELLLTPYQKKVLEKVNSSPKPGKKNDIDIGA